MAEAAFANWIGRSVETTDIASGAALRRLAATLDRPPPEHVVPLLGHWLFHLPDARQSALGSDGHPAKGGFLPPIAQPRRMWAGGRLRFLAPIRIGARLVKRTTIIGIVDKGAMTFVTLLHVIAADGEDAIVEEQDLVFLPIAPPAPPKPIERPTPDSTREMIADETMIFRFSALTFNAHRIHYDLPYAQEIEQYPALVVHGPLQAMLLIGAALDDGLVPSAFSFRGRSPLYAGRAFTVSRAGHALWVRDASDAVTMTAEVTA